MGITGKRVSTIGPGHDGAPKPGHYAAPGEAGLISHPHAFPKVNGQSDVTAVKATLGKPPKPKRAHLERRPFTTA